MLGYYKKHVHELAQRLRRLEDNQDDFDLLIETQIYILKRMLFTEKHIENRKREVMLLNANLKKQRLPKGQASEVKKKIKFVQGRIDQHQWLLYVWRCFGDGIAFIYLDKWAIKPFLYKDKTPDIKQSAGHIKGKEGLYRELALVLEAKKNGMPALLNDLTNVIRHGDVCLLGASDPYVIEVKSSSNTNPRINRQIAQIKNIHDYLETDQAKNIRGVPYCKRVELRVPEVNYIDLINRMIEEALHKGYSYSNPESGIHYFVLGAGSAPDSESFSKGIEQGIVYILNEAKNDQTWGCYYPFTLSIRKPELLYAFLKGDIYVMVVFDAAKMKTLALERGLSFSLLHEEDWAYGFERSVKEFEEPIKFKISQHFATRMALEFFSLKWVLDIHGHNMEEMEQQLLNQVEA